MRIRRRFVAKMLVTGIILFTFYSFRFTILRGMGNYLVRVDSPEKVDAIFVLSGNPKDRGIKAAEMYRQGYSKTVVCTGGEISGVLESYGIKALSCELTRKVLTTHGVDSADVKMLCEGTSTFEEYQSIKNYCLAHNYQKVMVVSSAFHTRRINSFFRSGLGEAGIGLVLIGAPESAFSEREWWKKEEGLIFLNNEYVKLMYYFWQY